MTRVDVGQVPGMSSVQAQGLNANRIFTTSDLLRNKRATIVSASGASLAAVRKWQSFSALLEIEGLTPALVETLMAAGVDGIDEYAKKPLATLRTVLAAATPALDDEAILKTLLDARKLQFTGVLNGLVVTTNDVPLENATVQCGGETALSDARGRFRMVGLRLGIAHTLTISHAAKKQKIFKTVQVLPPGSVFAQKFKLTGKPAATTRLSLLKGDVLPPFGTAPMSMEQRSEPLSPADRYVFSERYANGDAKVGSLFVDFDNGKFIVRTYRVKKADLPAGAQIGDRMLLENGALTVKKITGGKIGRLSRTEAVRQKYAGKVMTRELISKLAKDVAKALSDPK